MFMASNMSHRVKLLMSVQKGSFLWTRLMVESLKSASFLENIHQILENLPVGLDEIYQRMFDKAFASDAPRKELAIKILEYVTVSRRPLKIFELDDMLAIRPGQTAFSKQTRVLNLRGLIRQVHGPIIRIIQGQDTVELIHLSIKEFLMKNESSPIDVSRAHDSMATACLTYLNFKSFQHVEFHTADIQNMLEEECLLGYAVLSWGLHLTAVTEPSKPLLNALEKFLVSANNVLLWLRVVTSAKMGSTGQRVLKDLLLLEAHLRHLAKSSGLTIPEAVRERKWLSGLAEQIMEKLMQERGEDHLQTVEWYAVVGKFHTTYATSESYLLRAISGQKKLLGPRHPNTVSSMVALGRIYWNMKWLDQAEEIFKQSFNIREETLGADHPDTLEALSWVATVYRGKALYEESCEMYSRVIAGLEMQYGRYNGIVMREIKMLGVTRRAQGQYEYAESLFNESWNFFRDVQGDKHPDTVQCVKNLAMVYQIDGRFEEAEALHRDVIMKQEEVTGEDGELFISVHNLGVSLAGLRQYEDAEVVLQRALNGKDVWHGKKHPHTGLTLQALNELYEKRPDLDEGEKAAIVKTRLASF